METARAEGDGAQRQQNQQPHDSRNRTWHGGAAGAAGAAEAAAGTEQELARSSRSKSWSEKHQSEDPRASMLDNQHLTMLDAELGGSAAVEGGARTYSADIGPSAPAPKQASRRRRGAVIAWSIIGVVLAFLVVMAVVFTERKGHDSTPTLLQPLAQPPSPMPPLPAAFPLDPALASGLGDVFYVLPPAVNQEAATHFLLGLRLLHVFWYELAYQEFAAAAAAQPTFLMAYWGQALACRQMLWHTEDVAAGQAALSQLATVSASGVVVVGVGPKEQAYINAANSLFAQGKEVEQRERSFAAAMLGIYTAYPDDPDTCALYALSLMGMASSASAYLSATEQEDYLAQAAALLEPCAQRWPRHAGVLHYLVHAYDVANLTVAAKGTGPGESLSWLANSSSHAVHMKSHISLRFGDWAGTLDSNIRAVAASDAYCNRFALGDTCDSDNRYHALEWQFYALLQQCRFNESLALLARMQGVATRQTGDDNYQMWLYRMYSHYTLVSAVWPGPIGLYQLAPDSAGYLAPALNTTDSPFWAPHAEAHALLAKAYELVGPRADNSVPTVVLDAASTPSNSTNATLQSDVPSTLAALQARLATLARLLDADPSASDYMTAQIQVLRLATLALATVALCPAANASAGSAAGGGGSSALASNNVTCNGTSWTTLMEQALELEDRNWDFAGAPSLKIAPVTELYGRLIIAAAPAQAARAVQLFQTCLDRLPHRLACLLGMARAQMEAGDASEAARYDQRVAQQCGAGDFGWPGLVEARSRQTE